MSRTLTLSLTRLIPILFAAALGAALSSSDDVSDPVEPTRASSIAGDAEALVGKWIVDLRPTPDAPAHLKELIIESVEDGELEGRFYDTDFVDGRLNGDWGALRFAFCTADASGAYHTQGVLRGDRLEGTTMSVGRDFLAVWTAHRETPAGVAARDDHAAVRRAALDYVEGLYTCKPELLDRGVHPGLQKSGLRRRAPGQPYLPRRTMTYEELRDIAASRAAPKPGEKLPPYEIEVLEVMDAIACVRVSAFWGIDLMNLIKQDGEWKILQVVWQTHPRRS